MKTIKNVQKRCIFAPEKSNEMVTQLLIVWGLGVVAFFVLWAILAKVIKHISQRKHRDKNKKS